MHSCRSNRYLLSMHGYPFWLARNSHFRVLLEFDKTLSSFPELFPSDIFDRCLNRSTIVRRELIFVPWFDSRPPALHNHILRHHSASHFYLSYYPYTLNTELSINVTCSTDIFHMMISWRFLVMFGTSRGKKKTPINHSNPKRSVEKLALLLQSLQEINIHQSITLVVAFT